MNCSKTIIILFLLVSFLKVNAQNFESTKVSIADLEQKNHPIDTSAVAAILHKKARTYFVFKYGKGYVINHEYEIRIKIYKKEGLKWANFEIPFYVSNEGLEDETINFLNSITYNSVDGKIVLNRLNKEGVFKKKINKYWSDYSISLPNVKVGSIIEIRYSVETNNRVNFPDFNFQYEIPVNYAEYTTDILEMYNYKPILTGYIKVNSDIKLVDEVNSYSHKYNQEKSPYRYLQSKYTATNIEPLINESFVDNIKNYRGSIQHELEYKIFSKDDVENYSFTWEGVAKNIFEYSEFGRELKKEKYFEEDLHKIIQNTNSQTEKVNAVFKFVQNKMNWDKVYGIMTDKGVKQAYADATGNTAEINFILIAMLNSAGIKTDPVLISTVKNGVPVYPSRTGFNTVIAAAQVDGKQVLLDATNKFTSANILPLEDLNWTGRLIKNDGTSQEIDLVPKTQSNENINLIVSIDEKGNTNGKVRLQKIDYEALSFRENNEAVNKDNYREKLENDLGGIQISDYTIDNSNDLSKPITENFIFTADGQCDIIENKMYINPLLFFTQTRNPFVQEKRQMPIYFGYPKQKKYNVIIEIPEGYMVESEPKPVKITAGENIGSFSFKNQVSKNKIQVSCTIDINSAVIPVAFYDILKEFYQKIIEKQNEKIVLKKI